MAITSNRVGFKLQVFVLICDSGSSGGMDGSSNITGIYETLKLAEFYKPQNSDNENYYECYRIETYTVLNRDILIQNLKDQLGELEK